MGGGPGTNLGFGDIVTLCSEKIPPLQKGKPFCHQTDEENKIEKLFYQEKKTIEEKIESTQNHRASSQMKESYYL